VSKHWIVLRERARLRWGGDLRRHYVLGALAEQSDALDVDGWGLNQARTAIAGIRRRPWEAPPRLAAATMVAIEVLSALRGRARMFAVDFHDDPLGQSSALGIPVDKERTAHAVERKRRNLEEFAWLVVPSLALADLAGLDPTRLIVAGNGSDTTVIQPAAWHGEPVVGMASGASDGRGIESLIAACRALRASIPGLRLILWLAATGDASGAYLVSLRRAMADEPWIEFGSAPYSEMGAQLGRASILCVPNPPAAYWDAVAPIKLFDAMASGRPVVVTPRLEMSALVGRTQCGLVTEGDHPDDLAAAIARLIEAPDQAADFGANGRTAAVAEFDWRSISARLAADLEART
jgi:glycosyltransferase involved in cell wall biosynthesis